MVKVIVFGPTGKVASQAAQSAHQHGAEVILAMRDPRKEIPQLSIEEERQGNFQRVQADLTKPDTVREAVAKTGAKYAFIYVLFGHSQALKSSITTLKSAGIEFVVLLSSNGIQADDVRNVPPEEYIPYEHAQAEIHLEETFGSHGFVAVRPGYFASNTLQWKTMIPSGHVRIYCPDARFDYIAPQDIGRVCGTLLAGGPSVTNGRHVIRLGGRELISQKDVVGVIGKAVDKEIEVISLTESEAAESLVTKSRLPNPIANYLVNILKRRDEGRDHLYNDSRYEESVTNVKTYAGTSPMSLQQWVDINKHHFNES